MATAYLYIKSFHVIFMVTWFAGLFYLPRLFVYHAMADDAPGIERLKVMERKLFAMMTIGAVLTVSLGLTLWLGYGITGGWLHVKLSLALLLIGYHVWCWKLVGDFRADRNVHGHVFYRWFNEAPSLLLIAMVLLVIVRPF